MKSLTQLLLIAILLCAAAANAETARNINVIRQDSHQVKLSLSAPQPELKDAVLAGKQVKEITAAELLSTATPGCPELPVMSTLVAIPPQGSYQLSFSYSDVQVIPLANPKLAEGSEQYPAMTSGMFPAQIAEASPPAVLRDFRVVQLNVYPYQYDFDAQELRYYQNVQVTLNFTDEPGLNEVADYTGYSYAFSNIYEAQISNFEQYRNLVIAPANARILLIHGNSSDATFLAKLNEFVAWKRQKGFEVNVVSTQVAGSSNTQIKTYIQTQYNNADTRPDYIILLGDTSGSYTIPTWIESYSSYGGAGDYPYSHLAGSDLLGDVLIGRISVENLSQLTTVLGKVYAYEKNVNNAGDAAAWLNRLLLIGDTSSSGISCKYSNIYIKEMSQQVNPDYTYIENYSGGFPNTINTGINQGVAFFNYRGYIGMSGWSPSSSLSNGPRLPHAVILTCGTGSFNSTSTSEEFIRLGSEAQPKGALTAIGMATSGTHTMFNNALSVGIFDGLYLYKMRTMGEALLNGRLYLWSIYGSSNSNQANYFAHWCNLMGDPTVEAFIGIPANLNVSAPDTVAVGTSMVDVSVTDDLGAPVENASVTLFNAAYGNVVSKGFTDAAGNVTLNIPSFVMSQCLITVSKHDCKPKQQTLEIDPLGSLVYFDKVVLDDGTFGSIGNSDGFIDAGETVALWVNVKNTTAAEVSGIGSVLTSADPYVTITQSASDYAAIPVNGVALNATPFLVSFAIDLPAFHDARLTLSLSDVANTPYTDIFHLGAYNADLSVINYSVNAGGNGVLDPAENGILTLSVLNSSVFGVEGIQGQLTALNDLVEVTDSTSYFGNLPAGMTVNSVDGFGVFARPLLIPGMSIPFRLRLYNSSGFEQVSVFNVPIGTVAQNSPLGPDSYGYFIYDVTDTAYPDCPTYEWVEIVPSLGGSGSQITGLNDSGTSGDEGDQVGSDVLETIDLPFTFPFYGIDYNQITVCVNGFIALGATGNGEFRNGRMPGGQGPAPMIAPFWDDLVILSGGGIFRYYNADNHTFIVTFNNLKNGYNRTSEETFQVIFYDPIYYPTSMEDGMVKIQYKVFNNIDTGGGGYTPAHGNYATVGIRDHTNTRGLEYTYNNQYPMAAQPLSSQKALLITTVPILHQNAHLVVGEVILNDANSNGLLEPGETAGIGVKLNNLGLNTATNVQVSASTMSTQLTINNPASMYPNIPGSGSAVNVVPITVTASPDCPDGLTIAIQYEVNIDGNSWTYPLNVTISRASLQIGQIYINDIDGNCNGMAEPGETFKLIVNYANNTAVDTYNLTSNIMCLSEEVTIGNPQQLIPILPANTTSQAVYDVTLSQNVLVGNNLTFYLTYLGDQIPAENEQVMLSVGTTGMLTDFEADNGNFVPSPAMNGWQWGTDTVAGAHSGVKAWGTLINQQYPNNVTWTVTSPEVYIGSNFVLSFWHWYDMENTYDGGNVKISSNGGNTWNLLTPEDGYPLTNVAALNSPGFSGSNQSWTEVRCALASYQGQNVRFRWTFAADTMIQGQGWYIDDVQTTGFFPFAGEVSGIVSCTNPDYDFGKIFVKNSAGITTQPTPTGDYTIYLPGGIHTLTASAAGCLAESYFPVELGLTTPAATHDFHLGWFTPVTGLNFSVSGDSLVLTWTAPQEPLFPVTSYQVFRRVNAGGNELMGFYSDAVYHENLSLMGTYRYYVVTVYAQGESEPTDPVEFAYPYVATDDPLPVPLVTRLGQNYPNPFNPSTTISFDLARSGQVTLNVFNVRGQLVKTLANSSYAPGAYRLVWDGRDDRNRPVSSGVYFYRLQTPGKTFTRKMLMLK